MKVFRIGFFVPTLVTKVTDYLSWGWFFLETIFDFLTSRFDGPFFKQLKNIVALSLNLKNYFACKIMGV